MVTPSECKVKPRLVLMKKNNLLNFGKKYLEADLHDLYSYTYKPKHSDPKSPADKLPKDTKVGDVYEKNAYTFLIDESMLKKWHSWKQVLHNTELEKREFPDYKRYTNEDLDEGFNIMVIADFDDTKTAQPTIKEMPIQAAKVDMSTVDY